MNKTYENICSDVCWGRETNTDAIKLQLAQTYSDEEINEARKYAIQLMNKLVTAGVEDLLSEHNGYYGDSVHDCMCHMVAHGERVAQLFIEKPELAVKLFDSGGVVENFFYTFPDEYTRQMMSVEYHQNLARKYLDELKEIKSAVLFKYTQEFLNSEGGYDYDLAQTVLEEIQAGFKNESHDYKTIYKSTGNLGRGALFANVWSDFVKFCVLN